MEFGMFHEFPSMPGRGETEMFDDAMAQGDAAERWGLDVMWLDEIHIERERTYRNKAPPIRVAASTPDTFPAIGGQGYPVFASVRHVAWPDLAPQIRSYYDAYKAAGHPGKGQVFVSAPIYIAETEERARAEAEESLTHFYRLQYELIAYSARRSRRHAFIDRAER